MSRFRMILTAAIAAAGLAVGGAPAIAAVAQTHASHSVISLMAASADRTSMQRHGDSVMIPDSHCTRGGDEVTIYKAGCTDAKGLDPRCLTTSGKMPYSPAYIYNGCGTRVWLFTGDLTGTKICINPFSGNNGAFGTQFKYYQVTSNQDNCS